MQSLAGADKVLISLLVIHLSIHHLLIGTESLLCAGTLPSYEETVGPNADVPALVYLGRQVLPKNSLAKSGLGGRTHGRFRRDWGQGYGDQGDPDEAASVVCSRFGS